MSDIHMTRDFFLWCMSAIYLFAFTSIYVQIPGLYGDNGILPAKLVLHEEAKSLRELLDGQPTLLRLFPSSLGLRAEQGLELLCLGGMAFSFVAMISRSQRNSIIFALLWAFYLSIFQLGQTFLWFQWDILLLEVGFLSILVSPLNLLLSMQKASSSYHQHDSVTLWLVRWLLFRLMFASGVVKLTSQCPTWWGLTALNHHYESQCIPTRLAWFIHHLPEWFQKLSVVATYVIEIALPLLFFSPVRCHRIFAALSQIFLMVLIIFTGNYNFFNLLTIVLALSLLDDNFLRRCLFKRPTDEKNVDVALWRPVRWALHLLVWGGLLYWTVRLFSLKLNFRPFSIDSQVAFTSHDLDRFLQASVPISIWLGALSLLWEIFKAGTRALHVQKGVLSKAGNLLGVVLFGAAAFAMFAVSLVDHTVIEQQSQQVLWPVVRQWHQNTRSFEITSSYGLFRRMTGVEGRPEVIVEGSMHVDHGWKEYNFLYKPGNVSTPPPLVAPHQPRLDWQMWFAALGSYQHNPWFLNLVYRLFENQPEVLELMAANPFPEDPPKYIRATLYHYHFTESSHTGGDWWQRERISEYLPVITKTEPSFINYLTQTGIYNDRPSTDSSGTVAVVLAWLRAHIGQMSGFNACMSLFFSALCLTLLDPSTRIFSSPQ